MELATEDLVDCRLEQPKFVCVETTQRCNLTCKMCWHSTLGKDYFLGKDFPLPLLGRLAPFLERAEKIWLSGIGEPLLYPQIYDMVRACRRLNEEGLIGFTTNGTLFKPNTDVKLIESGLDQAQVSIDGLHPLGHSCGDKRLFSLVVRKIKELDVVKRKKGSSKPEILFSFVAMTDNLHELPDILRLAGDVGCSKVEVQPVVPISQDQRYQNVYRHPYYAGRMLDEGRRAAKEAGVELRLVCMSDDLQPKEWRCGFPFDCVYVDYRGDVAACCQPINTGQNVATSTLDEIWNGETYLRLRKELSTGHYRDACLNCCYRKVSVTALEYFLDSGRAG